MGIHRRPVNRGLHTGPLAHTLHREMCTAVKTMSSYDGRRVEMHSTSALAHDRCSVAIPSSFFRRLGLCPTRSIAKTRPWTPHASTSSIRPLERATTAGITGRDGVPHSPAGCPHVPVVRGVRGGSGGDGLCNRHRGREGILCIRCALKAGVLRPRGPFLPWSKEYSEQLYGCRLQCHAPHRAVRIVSLACLDGSKSPPTTAVTWECRSRRAHGMQQRGIEFGPIGQLLELGSQSESYQLLSFLHIAMPSRCGARRAHAAPSTHTIRTQCVTVTLPDFWQR